MKGRLHGDKLPSTRLVARQLHRRFDGLCSRVAEKTAPRTATRHQRFELSRKVRHLAVIKIGAGHVDQRRRLLLNGANNVRMTMACRGDGNARAKIEKAISVNVFDDGALSLLDNKWIRARV